MSEMSLAPLLGGFDYPFEGASARDDGEELAKHDIGLWECDLSDDSLTWSAGVYDIFGIARGARVLRDDIVRFYEEDSRRAMEALRSYAIRHRRGFTLNVEIRPSQTRRAWMKLSGAPVLDNGNVVGLTGVKQLLRAA
ncbi:MAG: hypothetical protein R3E04_06220 [Sphingobium sp.]